jgi:hypothetical protein
MTDPVPTQIRIALFDDNGEGDRFFLDVCGMLEALAQRAGVPLTLVSEQPAGSPPGRTYRCDGALPTLLSRELGRHRAQISKHKQGAGERIFRQLSFAKRGKPINAVTEVYRLAGEKDPELRDELLRSVPSKRQDAGDEGRRPKRSLIT